MAQNLTPKVIQSDSFIKRVSTNGNNLSVGQQIPTMPSAPGVRINEVFLDEKWKNSSIALYGSEKLIEGFRVRYELRSNSLELKISNQIKVLDVRRVKTLIWLDSLTNAAHYFVNGKEYLVDKVPFTSLLEVLSEGKVSLYKQYTYWIKKPDFVPSLDVGSVDERIYKKDIFFSGSGNELTIVPTKKKRFFSVFGDQAQAIKKFVDEKDLKVSKEQDLMKIFEYFNSLL